MNAGIDLGGTKIAAAIVEDGEIRHRVRLETGGDRGTEHVIGQLRKVLEKLGEYGEITKVGIGVPGWHEGTKIVDLPNLHALDGVDLKEALGRDVRLANDADCFALGESVYGAACDDDRMVGLTIGTGLGSGVILDGELYEGRRRKSPELGHLILDEKTQAYEEGMGAHDWEALLSGRAIERRQEENGGSGELANEIWESDDETCLKTREETNRLLAIFCANVIRIYDPGCIVLGGGAAVQQMADDVNALLPDYGCPPVVKLSTLGGDAAILGASLL